MDSVCAEGSQACFRKGGCLIVAMLLYMPASMVLSNDSGGDVLLQCGPSCYGVAQRQRGQPVGHATTADTKHKFGPNAAEPVLVRSGLR